MSFFDTAARLAADANFAIFSDTAIWNNQTAVKVIVSEEVERVSQYGEVMLNAYEVTARKQQIGNMAVGDTYETTAGVLVITKIVAEDRYTVTGAAGRQ
jgi:hypothetical protein